MAYNLQPLITILEGILDPDQSRWIVDENNPQLQSLLDKATSLQQLLDKSPLMTKLDRQIREVAHQAEDIIESHMVRHMLSGSNCVRFTLSKPQLKTVTRNLGSVMEQAKKLMAMEFKMMLRELDSAMEQLKLVDKKMPSSCSSSSRSAVVVGIDEDLMQLKYRLTGMRTKLEIVPIVGMGGVGKTTLARKLYEDPLIAYHFDYRAWTTVSQDYNMPQILKSLLRCIAGQEFYQHIDELKVRHIDELKVMLQKSLYGRRYLIVIDDIWSTRFWDEIKMYFPDNNKGSRIVITTRESDVANYADYSRPQHQVQLLSESESWNLLHQLVFGEEDCPPVLQDIGRKIASNCCGLPLAINVIGGLLSKIKRSEDVWKKFGDNVTAAISERSLEEVEKHMEMEDKKMPRELDSAMEQVLKPVEMEDKKMLREVDSAMEQLKLVEMEDKKMPHSSSSSSKSVVVGIDGDLKQLKDRLTCTEKKLGIIPIVGMGGVGKTTLARKLYEDPLIVDHFAYRAWATISQDYSIRQILKNLLRCIIGNECDQHTDELEVMFYKSLYGRKYLIVLDDIWSTRFWDKIRLYFPNNNNGSRIVITTWESDVANYADSLRWQHQVQLLSKSESWNLLRQLVFEEEDCPPELQETGQKIANGCGGLPLAISVIGGLLSMIERSEDAWEKIGNNVITSISESDVQCYSILCLSYYHLPNHLKPCFLYMGAFPEGFEIKGQRLVRLWVEEGFVKSSGERSLEEEAEDWLKSLVERNLFLVREYNQYGKPKSYHMHDMLRDLCIRIFDEDKFMCVMNSPNVTISNPRRMSFHTSDEMEDVDVSTESMSLIRSFIGIGFSHGDWLPFDAISGARFLRVLDLIHIPLFEFPTDIFEFVNLRFLGVTCSSRIPRGISRLWRLQTLIGNCWFDVPSELWQLSELRNIKLNEFELLKDEEMNYSTLEKLHMISYTTLATQAATWDGFLKSIPNIKKLAINDRLRTTSTAIDLSHLHKLETLRCHYIRAISFPNGSDFRSKVIFPCNVRKLVLRSCVINSGVLRTLCALQKLEVLKIIECRFKSAEKTYDAEWELVDGDEFCSLQFLFLQRLKLVRWIADETNFPRLRNLRVYDCQYLEEIPSSIGDIPTLQLIDLQECSESANASAKRIEEEQQSEYDNYDLKVRIS